MKKKRDPNSSFSRWAALIAALLGWLFDGFEIGLFPLVGPNALDELLHAQIAINPTIKLEWFGIIMAVFLVGAATGGVLFGWLGDRIGRVHAMSLSILTYAIFTGLCGFATEAWHIAVLRFIASLGMGGEWALGVSLVSELWPNRSRALIAGLIGAAANLGFLLVGVLSLMLVTLLTKVEALFVSMNLPPEMIDALLRGDGWRLLMITGALPALLIFFIRLFVPESEKWEASKKEGTTSLWATQDLLGVLVGALAAIGMIGLWSPTGMESLNIPNSVRWALTIVGLFIALCGYLYPVFRYLKRANAAKIMTVEDSRRHLKHMLIGSLLTGIPLLGTWGALQWAPKWSIALHKVAEIDPGSWMYAAKEMTQIFSAIGAIVGTILAALAGGYFGRKITYVMLCIGSFASLVFLYKFNDAYGINLLLSVFLAGAFTAAFYGWFPLYLPELFPTSIRATSQGFAFNFGRILAAIGSLQTAVLTAYFSQNIAPDRVEVEAFPNAGATLAVIYLIGIAVIALVPETKGKPLPD